MNDEIKEKIKAYYIGNDIDKLLDYITNLQEENERLKEEIQRQSKALCINDKLLVNYRDRIDKAIEYINKNIVINFDKVGFDTNQIAGIVVDKLLEILQGGDEE